MGRTRTRAAKNAKPSPDPTIDSLLSKAQELIVQAAKNAKPSPDPAIDSLLSKAQDLIVQCDYPLARKFIERVLVRDDAGAAEKVAAREALGVVLLELGELSKARDTFLALLPPHPDAPAPPPPSAHLYLAQLSSDDPYAALAHYQAAIDILHAQLKGKHASTAAPPDDDELKGNIVRAYVAMVEIWMDPGYDLCFDPAAEQTCESLLARALEIDPSNPEALLALASVRTSQQRPADALALLHQSHTLLPADASIPTRLALAKMFVELGAYAEALSVLQAVLAADDTEVEAWYIEGWAFWLMGERAKERGEAVDGLGWEELWRDARDCLETCRSLHAAQEHHDEPLLEHVQELLSNLGKMGIQPSPVEEGADEEDEGWEDASDEDVDME
ncbi:TPR-like protein [Leucogyrophana mollusca]|uniref:TPR-like protein n=1 Tax=Leucogyrophana mollusca TaxID=85980 RepID=A0ACB8AYC8_9AGAM|nr:TPR-like protein [Leucogyrophana mollusca]